MFAKNNFINCIAENDISFRIHRLRAMKGFMNSSIHLLDDQTINQIAAGEVIENPASVVKELIENSLDAGATQILIEIAAGGRQLIKVVDDGKGMNATDALLCFQRHATSKIHQAEDLENILTMGFRGEALPSIASISKLTLITSTGFDQEGTLIVMEGGVLIQQSSVPHSRGTTIEIKDLFYNAPVRKKFQKSFANDTNEILKAVGSIALAFPSVHFQLISNHKILLSTQTAYVENFIEKFELRVKDIMGSTFDQSHFFEFSEGDIHLKGVIGTPLQHRNNRSGQQLFINQRTVSCPAISYAISEGYGTLLPPRRFPIFALHLSIPGSLIDVNVHPQKREIRLRSSTPIRNAVIRAIEQALLKPEKLETESVPFHLSSFDMDYEKAPISSSEWNAGLMEDACFEIDKEPFAPILNMQKQVPVQSKVNLFDFFHPKLIGIWSHFILLDASCLPESAPFEKNGIVLVDQRRAHARVLFEEFLNKKESIVSEELLVPMHLQFSPAESQLLQHYLMDLNSLGLGIRFFGSNSFIVDALPKKMSTTDVEALMHEILNHLDQFSKDSVLKIQLDKHAALAAVKAAVNRSTSLSLLEAESLIKKLFTCGNPYYAPQGQEIMTLLSSEEIKKKLYRKDHAIH